jgi:hypothetical protein
MGADRHPLPQRDSTLRSLVAILIVSVLLVAIGSSLWGWAGPWALTALVPGVFLGHALAHVAQVRSSGARLRLGFVMMGVFLGATTAFGSFLVQRAATLPPQVKIVETRSIDAPREWVWDAVSEPLMWTRWDASIGALEAGSGAIEVGDRLQSTMLLHGQRIATSHVLRRRSRPAEVTWSVEPRIPAYISGLQVSLRLEAVGATTVASYTVEYELPTVRARVVSAALESDFRAGAAASLVQLSAHVADSLQP